MRMKLEVRWSPSDICLSFYSLPPIQPSSNFRTLEGPCRTLDPQILILLSILAYRMTLHMNITQVVLLLVHLNRPKLICFLILWDNVPQNLRFALLTKIK
jgi:hypothetical protein